MLGVFHDTKECGDNRRGERSRLEDTTAAPQLRRGQNRREQKHASPKGVEVYYILSHLEKNLQDAHILDTRLATMVHTSVASSSKLSVSCICNVLMMSNRWKHLCTSSVWGCIWFYQIF